MIPDKTLQHGVLAELEFEPSINAAHIGVAAKDGVITLTGHVGGFEQKLAANRDAQHKRPLRIQQSVLTGTVNNWHQRKAADRIARSVPGVKVVQNQLAVEPQP